MPVLAGFAMQLVQQFRAMVGHREHIRPAFVQGGYGFRVMLLFPDAFDLAVGLDEGIPLFFKIFEITHGTDGFPQVTHITVPAYGGKVSGEFFGDAKREVHRYDGRPLGAYQVFAQIVAGDGADGSHRQRAVLGQPPLGNPSFVFVFGAAEIDADDGGHNGASLLPSPA